MERKFSSDLEIPKYLKWKENDISKANKKSKHKHQYEECLIRYKWNWDEHKIHTSLNSYCTICGKINDKMKNSIVIDYMQKVDTPVGKRYRQISEDVLYETYHDRLPVFGNILENDKNRKEEIYYLQSTLRAWYSDMREKLLEGYQNGRFTILPEWDE